MFCRIETTPTVSDSLRRRNGTRPQNTYIT
jgi:hypothetical protein